MPTLMKGLGSQCYLVPPELTLHWDVQDPDYWQANSLEYIHAFIACTVAGLDVYCSTSLGAECRADWCRWNPIALAVGGSHCALV